MVETEHTIVASCLAYEKCFDQAVFELSHRDFYFLGPIFKCIEEFHRHQRPHEDIMFDVQEMVKKKNPEHEFNLNTIIDQAVPSITELIKDLRQARLKSDVANICMNLEQAAYQDDDIIPKVLKAVSDLGDLTNSKHSNAQTMGELMSTAVKAIEKAKKGEITGLRTGLDIDKKLQGLQNGQFYILASRPSMGKTALALQIARNVDVPVAFLSLETTNASIGIRHLASHMEMDSMKLKNGQITDEDLYRISESASSLSNKTIITDDSTDLSAAGLEAKANHLKRKYDIGLIIVDYIQLMQSDKKVREQQIAEMSRGCHRTAKRLDIPVLGLAQLSRDVEKRGGNKRPVLADLRESGSLEQDSYAVMFIYRPEYYGISTYPSGTSTKGIAEIIIAKHKDGPTGTVQLLFRDSVTKFENLMSVDETEPHVDPF